MTDWKITVVLMPGVSAPDHGKTGWTASALMPSHHPSENMIGFVANCDHFGLMLPRTKTRPYRSPPLSYTPRFLPRTELTSGGDDGSPAHGSDKTQRYLGDRAMSVTTIDRTRTQRAREVENALASVRMEGLEISSEAAAMFQQYVDGEVTSEELDCALDRLFERKYGPVRLPRNECP
jgi:hypothetical protein